jgi:tRNA-specific 2-thiouridylase
VKFGAFLHSIDDSFERVASGHYAQVELGNDGVPHLLSSPDAIKDQTYFLAHMQSSQLARALFPIGHLTKDAVRAYAHEQNLPNKERKDSQGLCFLGKLKFRDFIKHHVGESPGPIIEHESGNIVGEHKGFWFHTIGQRQGLGLPGGPWYVTAKDVARNIVFVSRNYYTDDKIRDSFTIDSCNWLEGQPNQQEEVKIRHGAQRYVCRIEAEGVQQFRIFLDSSDQGIAPGQFAVFYRERLCLGSGIINGW